VHAELPETLKVTTPSLFELGVVATVATAVSPRAAVAFVSDTETVREDRVKERDSDVEVNEVLLVYVIV
jgi:hypothetical protein